MYKSARNNSFRHLKMSGLALAVASLMTTSMSYADNSASAYRDLSIVGAEALAAGVCDADGFCPVLSTELKNSGTVKDLVIGVSFETMLMTSTAVRSKGGNKSESVADAKIVMKVYVDGEEANPKLVTFDYRKQELWASFSGVLDCTDGNGDGIIQYEECNFDEMDYEEVGLMLDTARASTFNFLAYDIGSGSHTIEVWAQLTHSEEVVNDTSTSRASAALGNGTLSVWEVHGGSDTGTAE
ncbi:hypothetical protein [Microbulbifer marinus]|uniref:Uncharacterized protein n=1 Tax=Microbulbifer marinus TaxID=658218 RepID=A0A1H4AKZ8_9GAMM|nr:hypothetical protein [Microbulbifer marinus]SEA36457.1 hypothetical protein SAMN05216562_2848 [Microbulbifer marinus]